MTMRSELWAAGRILQNMSERVHLVDDHVRCELAEADSFRDHTTGASDLEGSPRAPLTGTCTTQVPIDADLDVWRVCGRYRPCGEHDDPVTLTPTERAAQRRIQLNRDHSAWTARGRLLIVMATEYMQEADKLMGERLARIEVVDSELGRKCCDGQVGKDGAFDWGDPTCESDAVKSGLCLREYWRWYRWRKENGKKTPEIAPAEDGAA